MLNWLEHFYEVNFNELKNLSSAQVLLPKQIAKSVQRAKVKYTLKLFSWSASFFTEVGNLYLYLF